MAGFGLAGAARPGLAWHGRVRQVWHGGVRFDPGGKLGQAWRCEVCSGKAMRGRVWLGVAGVEGYKMKYLSLSEQQQLIKTVWEIKGADRDAVIIELILNTGLRVSELAGLLISDVRNKDELFVRPEIAKRKHSRTITLSVITQDMLFVWISRKLGILHENIDDAAPLFVSRLGAPLTKRAVQLVVEKWMIKAGIRNRGRLVHALRHTYAMRARERGVDIETIQEMLGHTSLASTGVYVKTTHAKKEEMARLVSISASRAARINKMKAVI